MMTEQSRKTLLVVEHGVTLNGAAYKKLADAGYIVVRGDPSQFHVMETVPSGHADAITDAALATLRLDYAFSSASDVRARFASELLKRVQAR